MPKPTSFLFQAAKLGDRVFIQNELEQVPELLDDNTAVGRVYGASGGVLSALSFTLAESARRDPEKWGKGAEIPEIFSRFWAGARSRDIRSFTWWMKYGRDNLDPLRLWIEGKLFYVCGKDGLMLSELPVPLHLIAMDKDGLPTFFGPPDNTLQFQYHFMHIGPPQDAPVADAIIAAVSTLLSTEPTQVNGQWYRDTRPAMSDLGAIITDLEANDPRPLWRTKPYVHVRDWQTNFLTSSFIMHSFVERNQALLAEEYIQQVEEKRCLDVGGANPKRMPNHFRHDNKKAAGIYHIQLPYVGSTEAATNMRDSAAHKDELMEKFRGLLAGQTDEFPFDQPANLIYGAGGFSGILAGLVAAGAVDEGLRRKGGEIRQVYGVSAGVINGFFHAVQIAAQKHPEVYQPAAKTALKDLESFIAGLEPKKVVRVNVNPFRFWKGWANLSPLRAFFNERLSAYTGCSDPESLTFNDIQLPLTVTAADSKDGFCYFLGMSQPERKFEMGGHTFEVWNAPIIQSLIAGWSMNTYIEPQRVLGHEFQDGGGPFYDIGYIAARLDKELTNLINIHLDEPDGHSYNLPPRPTLLRLMLDTHNYSFPEERRRMYFLSNLYYENESRKG
ncbi:MAG TPA: hypothetical protein VN376_03935 [Longilinea sp.]|nr:hypothetical protein [Longilinea sp.]